MRNIFVVVSTGAKHIPRLILQYRMTSYLVTNADWNYLGEGDNMSGDQRKPDYMTSIPPNQ